MTDQPYVVLDDRQMIMAAFSNEDLAQTHAAKLRGLRTSRGLTYTVAPFVLDTEVGLEIEYYASLEMPLTKLKEYTAADIETGNSDILTRTLQNDIVDTYLTVSPKSDHEALHIGFDAYGWSPEHALAKLHAMVAAYLANSDPQVKP